MTERKQLLRVVILITLLGIVGCKKAERYAQFSNEDQAMSWSEEREKTFGDYDYTKIKTEKDAFDILQDKYKVLIPTYYKEMNKTLSNNLTSKTVQLKGTNYAIFARNKELDFQAVSSFYRGNELQAFSEINLKYVYSLEKKEAYLKSQTVSIKIAPVKGKLPNNNETELIEAIGKNMKMSDKQISEGIAGYEKQVKESNERLTSDYTPVVSNSNDFNKSKEFLKEIAVGHDQEGTLREIYAEISDQQD
ncbi:hypothetical protein IGJ02_000497 [Enterococcus sp. DIV0724b]|uniref:hypothetical protein n=1 Tax=Enterococcus sp. DIV0724b TaxID=2774694 RepID=UPI003D2FF993